MWRRLLSNAVAVSLMATGLVVLAQPVAHAAADAVVSGAVVDSVTHQPLASVTVTDSTSGRTATTTPAGTYSLSVPAGDHVLTATLADYVPYSTPTLTLTAAQTLTQGFTLEKYASASGTVTEKGTSTGIGSIVVKFFDATTQSSNPLFAATTGPDGSWAISQVAPGSYKVEFDPNGTDFADHWYSGSSTRVDAAAVSLAAGEAKVITDSLLRKAKIHGKVAAIYESFAPVAGATVVATAQSGSVQSTVTDAAGLFAFGGLADGRYNVKVSRPGYSSMASSTGLGDPFPIHVGAGDNLDTGLRLLYPGGSVKGTVHLPAGVTAVVICGGVRTTTAADGSYSFSDVMTGMAASVSVYAPGYDKQAVSQYVYSSGPAVIDFTMVASSQSLAPANGTVTDPGGQPLAGVTVSDAMGVMTTTTDASGAFTLTRVDPTNLQFTFKATGFLVRTVTVTDPTAIGTVTLHRPASITGRVTVGPQRDPAVGVPVVVSRSDGWSLTLRTNSDGRYTVDFLDPGYYKVLAQVSVGPNTLVTYVGGALSEALATYLAVDGTVLTDQDITVASVATLSGVVRQDGSPVGAGCRVALIGMGTGFGATTAADGTFTITGIQPGTYRLSSESEYGTAWWSDAPTVDAATEITIKAGDSLTGYVIAVPVWHSLSGTVRSPGGAALPNTAVGITNGVKRWVAYSDQAGHYSTSLPAGAYELGASIGGYWNWSPGSATPDLITLTSDVVKDFVVPPTVTLTLNVTTSDGTPTMVSVSAYSVRGDFLFGTTSQSDTVAVTLQPGTFTIKVFSLYYLKWSSPVTLTGSSDMAVMLDAGGRIGGTRTESSTVTAINTATGERFSAGGLGYTPYEVTSLPAGDYVLTAALGGLDPCGPAVWYGGSSYQTAQRLHVTSGTVLKGINLTPSCQTNWSPGGTVYGGVAMPPSAPVGAVTKAIVQATSTVGSFTTVPDADGSFTLTMPPGTYTVSAYQPALGLEAHASVTVVTGSSMIIALTMVRTGLITGRVVGPLGEEVPAELSSGETSLQTDTLGNFSFGGLSYGSHTISVHPSNVLYAPRTVDITVAPGADTVATIRVELAGTISGEFADDLGSVQVTVTDVSGRVLASGYQAYRWSVTGLPPGQVKVRFAASRIVTEWWRDATDAASATVIQLPSGGGVTDITPSLRRTTGNESLTTISGKVTFVGSGLGGVTLSTTVASQTVRSTTAADGTYSLSVPRGDTYAVRAEVCFGPADAVCAGEQFVDSRDVIADETTKTGVDFVINQPPDSFTVAPQPVITGNLRMGQTLTASVAAWSPAPDTTTWQWYADGLPIYSATASTYVLTDVEKGKRIQVVVTRSKAGYATITLPSAPTDPVDVAGAIHALTPSRLLDSRVGLAFNGPAVNGTAITLPVWGRGGVPQGASAVLVNLTVTQATAGGFLTAYASGGSTPTVSNANFVPGATIANLSLVPIGADGAIVIKVGVAGSVQVIADVQGYIVGGSVSAAGAVVPVTPTRLRDTRATGHLPGSGVLTLPVAGVAGVPADATAVVVNITVTGPTGPGYLTAWPSAQPRPTASNVNFVKNQTVPNMAIVKVGDAQSISIFNANAGQVDVVVDIQGYITAGAATLPGTVKPITPTRVVDTRIGLGAGGPVAPNYGAVVDFDSPDLENVPQGALINLTAADPRASGWLAAYPYGVDRPGVSNLNFTAGAAVPNLSLVTLGDGYGVLYNGSTGTVQMVADVLAYVLS